MTPWTTVLGAAGIATLALGTGAAPALASQPVPAAHASACLSEPPLASTHMVPAVGDAHTMVAPCVTASTPSTP
jgi:hypothetical protein